MEEKAMDYVRFITASAVALYKPYWDPDSNTQLQKKIIKHANYKNLNNGRIYDREEALKFFV